MTEEEEFFWLYVFSCVVVDIGTNLDISLVLCHICTNWLYMRALLQLSWLCGNSWIKSVQKIDKLDCELYKYYNYIFEFIFSVLHEIFIQDWRKFTTKLLYSLIFMFLKLKWYPKNTFLNNDCPNAILVKAFWIPHVWYRE